MTRDLINTQFIPHPTTHPGSIRRWVHTRTTRRCYFDKAPVVCAFSETNYFLHPTNLLWSNVWTFICPPWIMLDPVPTSEFSPYISTSLQVLTKGLFCGSVTLRSVQAGYPRLSQLPSEKFMEVNAKNKWSRHISCYEIIHMLKALLFLNNHNRSL
jgi:hypothetical protein